MVRNLVFIALIAALAWAGWRQSRTEPGANSPAAICKPALEPQAGRGIQNIVNTVTIAGAVENPGPVPWVDGLRLWRALQLAGGLSADSSYDGIRVVRPGRDDSTRLRVRDNPFLQPGDEVTVASEVTLEPKFKPGDSVPVRVFGVPMDTTIAMSGNRVIKENGTIELPELAQPVRAAGLTARELEKEIEKACPPQWEHPSVMIGHPVCRVMSGYIHVGGEITRPDAVKWQPGMRLDDAIAITGGVTPYSDLTRVSLWRRRTETVYDLSRLAAGEVPELEPDDQIGVPSR